ncbi:ABC transporter ATP-binding protein [Virgibacillus dokdonensis]|uniref:ABC transporter ATP-binding protein n=1 Tax=Virgibacillus dokdonensis TaxID=302167 RepID=UPI000989DA82|nr:ABC transporter ATP-binding protein [Virgibacillus dokdonensis]
MESAVSVKNVTKKYMLYEDKWGPIKELFSKKKLHNEFFALKDFSLDFPVGETIGVLGKNGSGKSTLLKIITGIAEPTNGCVNVKGSLVFLDVSSGIDSELSGYDNIFMKGVLLGYSRREMLEKVEDIIEFSELGEFIYQPVKNYSSGMKSKLGFAISVNVDPDILIVDEALAVGDELFRKKCMNKMNEFKFQGKTIIFVSHDKNAVESFCNEAAWIEKGQLIMYGDAKYVSNMYKEFMSGNKTIDEIRCENKLIHSLEKCTLELINRSTVLNFSGTIAENGKSETKGLEFVIKNVRTGETISKTIDIRLKEENEKKSPFAVKFSERDYPFFFKPDVFSIGLRYKDVIDEQVTEVPFWAKDIQINTSNGRNGSFLYEVELLSNNTVQLIISNRDKLEQQIENIGFKDNLIKIQGVAFVKGFETATKDDVNIRVFLYNLRTFKILELSVLLFETDELINNKIINSDGKTYKIVKFITIVDINDLEVGKYEMRISYKYNKEPFLEAFDLVWASKRENYPSTPYYYNNSSISLEFQNKRLKLTKAGCD